MTELRKLLARALWTGLPRLYEETPPPGGALEYEHIRVNEGADAIIAALKANGLMVVPDQITREMGDMLCYDYDIADLQRDWIACLSASPYAKEFE